MRLIRNSGRERVVDLLQPALAAAHCMDVVSPKISLFGFVELLDQLKRLDSARLVLPSTWKSEGLLGDEVDRVARNRLQTRRLAAELSRWIEDKAEVRLAVAPVPQGTFVLRDASGDPTHAYLGSLAATTEGLGLAPGNPMNLIQSSESAVEAALLAGWFDTQWSALSSDSSAKSQLVGELRLLADLQDPSSAYAQILNCLFSGGQDLDEEVVIRGATGIKSTAVWQRLFKFQRDGVVGAIDKLDRFGGCIIADSVGLGKTFEALAVIKYHELRNDRVLVLCPKRLRDNWSLFKVNDRRNILVGDRFNYDILSHTDLSRDRGLTGEIDLANLNWGNYDLLVIDESHNFRNKQTPKMDGETRYDRLMRKIIQEGVKTRVLMLSATPVNNRLADLRNQIAFATEGKDAALADQGIESIERTTRLAQAQFNRWLKLDGEERTPSQLIEMLGFDYFKLLDLLTIARSRKHIERYYGLTDTGRFPERLKPVNVKPDVDLLGGFPAIRDINLEIRRLHLAAYAPLRYVLPSKQAAYDAKYSVEVKGGAGLFRQVDREENLIHLLRVNLLKRMESSVVAFALTLDRQLRDLDSMIERIATAKRDIEELEVEDVDLDDPALESQVVGKKVKVLLKDLDLVRWRQDLEEDRRRLESLRTAATAIDVKRDAKLAALKEVVAAKHRTPMNGSNRKILVFTAFADTAAYLYESLVSWAKDLGVEMALVTGAAGTRSTLPGLRNDMASILTAFAPLARERSADAADEGELDLIIATDCISEGQNLQDCDMVINYDIHWNPVRIIQRFGRIDRLGSPNAKIQLVNFWPNMELDEYINLEQRVSGRMVLLDISATGEENVIEAQSGDQMNDLEYRRTQLQRLQETVVDLEDISAGVSITDLSLTDFRIDLAEFKKSQPGRLSSLPLGVSTVVRSTEGIPPGIVFCLRIQSPEVAVIDSTYPLEPYFLVHVGADGAVPLPYSQVKQILDHLKALCAGRDAVDDDACRRWDEMTNHGKDMHKAHEALATAMSSVLGRSEERAVESLFVPGGTHGLSGDARGVRDFEVLAYVVILPAS